MFTESTFKGHRQCSVKIPTSDGGAIQVSAREKTESMGQKNKKLKHVCALKMILRLIPAQVRTWGDLLAHVADLTKLRVSKSRVVRLNHLPRGVTEAEQLKVEKHS